MSWATDALSTLEQQKLHAVRAILAQSGWAVRPIEALTPPDPRRVVGFEATHDQHGSVWGNSLRELVDRVERKAREAKR